MSKSCYCFPTKLFIPFTEKPNFLIIFFTTVQFSMYNRVLNVLCGGDEESRTPDPLLARQVLSQLSYTPTCLLQVRCLFFSLIPVP